MKRCNEVCVWYQFTYEGWDIRFLREVFDSAFDRLGATESLRFWH